MSLLGPSIAFLRNVYILYQGKWVTDCHSLLDIVAVSNVQGFCSYLPPSVADDKDL